MQSRSPAGPRFRLTDEHVLYQASAVSTIRSSSFRTDTLAIISQRPTPTGDAKANDVMLETRRSAPPVALLLCEDSSNKEPSLAALIRRMKAGESLLAISKALDIGDGSLRLWMRRFEATPSKFNSTRRVIAAPVVRQRIALATPDRFRFEGLDLEAPSDCGSAWSLNERLAELLEDLNNRRMWIHGVSRHELFDRLDRPALRTPPPVQIVRRPDFRRFGRRDDRSAGKIRRGGDPQEVGRLKAAPRDRTLKWVRQARAARQCFGWRFRLMSHRIFAEVIVF